MFGNYEEAKKYIETNPEGLSDDVLEQMKGFLELYEFRDDELGKQKERNEEIMENAYLLDELTSRLQRTNRHTFNLLEASEKIFSSGKAGLKSTQILREEISDLKKGQEHFNILSEGGKN